MDIFSKRDGPRPEDVRARQLISKNAGTIRRLADQITNGGFTKMREDQARRREAPKPDGLLIYDMSAPARQGDPVPYVRASLNGRVVLVDRNSGRQIQLLGEIRGTLGASHFVLATEDNGFLSPVSEEMREVLGQFDKVHLGPGLSEADLTEKIAECLGLSDERDPARRGSGAEAGKEGGIPHDDSSELL